MILRFGDFIHLKNNNGVYRVIGTYMKYGTIRITCKKWLNEFIREERKCFTKVIFNNDVKCLHGDNMNKKRFEMPLMNNFLNYEKKRKRNDKNYEKVYFINNYKFLY